jgi:SAM-dependent methyltransferase
VRTDRPGASPSPFAGYLLAKQSLDTHSLHPRVWSSLISSIKKPISVPISVLDVGCGTGASFDRLLAAGVFESGGLGGRAFYTGVDRDPELIALASDSVRTLLVRSNFQVSDSGDGSLVAQREHSTLEVELVQKDVFDFARAHAGRRQWSLLTAHAFLDLFDVDTVLDALWPLLQPGGLGYFSLGFDDLTVIEPPSNIQGSDPLLEIYHQTMYQTQWGGSNRRGRAGRALFGSLRSRSARIIDAGPSDWVIIARDGFYTDDERIVLEFLLRHIADVVRATNTLDSSVLSAWLTERLAQVENRELVYIAHQLDVLAAK